MSILGNAPGTFKGRKLGVLVSDGVDAGLLQAVQAAFKQEGAVVKLVAPMVGGVEASDGSWITADEKIDGGPSVVFDAVAVLLSDAGAALLGGGGDGPRFRRRRLRPLQVHRPHRRGDAAAAKGRRGTRRRRSSN